MTFPLQWYLLFLASIPQTILIALVGFALFGIYLPWKKILIIALIAGPFSYFILFFPMVFGLHTLIDILFFALVIVLVEKIRFLYAMCAIVAGVTVLAVIEGCILQLYLHFAKVSIEAIKANQYWLVIMSFSELIVMTGVFLLIKRFNFKLWKLSLDNLKYRIVKN